MTETPPPPHGWLPDIHKGWEGGTLKGLRTGSLLTDGQTSGDVVPGAGLAYGQTSSHLSSYACKGR